MKTLVNPTEWKQAAEHADRLRADHGSEAREIALAGRAAAERDSDKRGVAWWDVVLTEMTHRDMEERGRVERKTKALFYRLAALPLRVREDALDRASRAVADVELR